MTIVLELLGLYTCWFVACTDSFTTQYRNHHESTDQ